MKIPRESQVPTPRVALLEGAGEDDEEKILGTLYKPRPQEDSEEQVLQYAAIHDGNVNIADASSVLKMPSDDVEKAMLTLIAQGKVRMNEGGAGT